VVVTLKEPMPIGEVRDIVTDKWEKAKVNEVQLPTQRLLEPSELETIRKNPEKIKELLTEAELADTEMADAVEQFLADPKHSMYLFEPSTMYRVVVLNPELPDVQNSLAAAFVKGNESLLVDDSVVIGQVGKYQPEEGEKKEEEPKPQPQAGGAAPAGEKPSGDKPSSDESGGDKPAGDKPASGPSDGAALPHYGDPQFVNLLGDPTGDAPAGDAPTGDAPTGDAPTGGEPADGEAPAAGDKPSPPVPEEDGDTAPKVEPPKTEPPETGTPTTGPPATEPPRTEPPATEPPSRGPAPKDGEEGDDTGDKDGTIGVTQLQLSAPVTFKKPIRQSAVKELFRDTAEELDLEMGVIAVEPTDPTASTKRSLRDWTLHSSLDQESFDALLSAVRKEVESKPFWQMSGKIGGKEAGLMQSRATAALIVCLIGIIGYIWVRFQQVIFGLAAVVALVHDVLITLGALALSYWLAGPLGFLMIEEFKISLPVVAAFLTIIGYSLNDTIVVFDRIREVRGRSPVITKEIINTSINQTLGRTLLTSFTTLIVVLLLYVLGGQAIHTFAFCLLIGVVVGTYSSIFVASPVLLWMAGNKTSQSAGQNA